MNLARRHRHNAPDFFLRVPLRQTQVMVDLSTLAASGATVIAAGLGAYISGRYGHQTAERGARRERRQALADAAIAANVALRRAFQESNPDWTGRDWEILLDESYGALQSAGPVLPGGLRHLRRSVRAACGEALGGVAAFELVSVRERMELADFDPVWSQNARDYLDVVVASLRRWREASERNAQSTAAPNFDEWLRLESRYARN